MTKAEREKISEVLELLDDGMTETAKRILRQLRDFGVKAGPSHDREDVGIGHDKTQIVDYIAVRLEGA
ncbi:MAG: hypothetical protein ACYSW3_00370 [Planctomycetota bacterium]|jgi:hypothetical protein